jgi:hypothetical protein
LYVNPAELQLPPPRHEPLQSHGSALLAFGPPPEILIHESTDSHERDEVTNLHYAMQHIPWTVAESHQSLLSPCPDLDDSSETASNNDIEPFTPCTPRTAFDVNSLPLIDSTYHSFERNSLPFPSTNPLICHDCGESYKRQRDLK